MNDGYVYIEFEAYWICPKCEHKNPASFGIEQYELVYCRECGEGFKADNEFPRDGDC